MKAAETAAAQLALEVIVNAILDRYEALKAERQFLDFDDLIARARALLERSSARWVLQKLDAGIDHILVDEAQDTSAAQWDILNRISEDFFAGEGQACRARSFFAVGDEKQSIFSFQGASAGAFRAKEKRIREPRSGAQKRLRAGRTDAVVPLRARRARGGGQGLFVSRKLSRPVGAGRQHAHGASGAQTRRAFARRNLGRDRAGRKEARRDWRLPLDFPTRPIRRSRRRGASPKPFAVAGAGFGRDCATENGVRRPIRPATS